MRRFLLFLTLTGICARADKVVCECDVKHPETLEARQCSLCREAEKQPAETTVFFLKDTNPTKPNRWLALPRVHDRSFDQLNATQRGELLRAAMEKARSLFGDAWAIAYNAPQVQTQCHVHIHLGTLLPDAENSKFIAIPRIEDVPVPPKGEGFWVHEVGGILHLHTGEEINETVLLR